MSHAQRHHFDEAPKPIGITDRNPHIVWTDTHQYVILQIQTNGSLYIFTNDNTVTNIPPKVYSRPNFDFRECLSEEHDVRTFAKPDKFARCLTVDEKDPQYGASLKYVKQCRSLVGEFHDKTYLASTNKPIKTVHRRSTKDDSETNPARKFTFRNFGKPNKEFYDCWYHPSNHWQRVDTEMYLCHKTICDVLLVNNDEVFSPTGVMIRPPLPHQCGINRHLIDDSVSRFLYRCPSAFTLSSDPENPIVQCKPKFTYLTSPVSHLFPNEELDSLLTDVILTFARAWNLPQHRCRLEFDNPVSQFWMTIPINERLIEVYKNPVVTVHSLTVTNQFREALDLKPIDQLIPDLYVIDMGRYLLSTVITTTPQDYDHFDISTLPQLVFDFVDDMDARDRGFTWFHRHHHYIIYQNIREIDLYAIGNLRTNVFIDFMFQDGQVTRAWKRYEQVVRSHVITSNMDLRPIIRQEHPGDAKMFSIPGTDVIVHHGEQYLYKPPKYKIEWTPVVIPCHPYCVPPKTLYQFSYNQSRLEHGAIKGIKRSITIRNDFFNNLVRHNIPHICTATFQHYWKCTKYGPISFLICGSFFNELNVLDFHDIQGAPTETDQMLTLTFYTFSPTFGLCGFSEGMVFQFTDAKPQLTDESDPKLCSLPQWSCSPGCRAPASIAKLKILDSPEFREWLSELALNVYKLKYFHSEPTTFKCTINRHAEWRVLTKGRFQTFFCTNFAMFGLNFRLPIHHPKRWIMAYCFTEEELRSLPWTKDGGFWTATLTNAIVTRQKKQFPMYSVYWVPSGDTCVFHLGRLGMAQPILDSLQPHSVVYSNRFEADSSALETLLRGSKMDSITSSTLETMVLRVLQSHRALEYDILKASLRLKGSQDPNPEDPEWKALRDKFASALVLDNSLTPADSQSNDGVDDDGGYSVNTSFQSDDDRLMFKLDLDDSYPSSSQSTSSTL